MSNNPSDVYHAPYETIKTLIGYLWAFRWRISLALALMILAKLATIAVPLILKDIVDQLDQPSDSSLLIQLPLMLLLIYGALRFMNSLFNQLRDLVFAKAVLNSIRTITLTVFDHLQNLSLAYHLQRKTGGLSRDIDRGGRAVNELLRVMIFSIFPTLFELTVVCIILFVRYEPRFVIVTLITIVSYGLFTYSISNWRLKFRKRMNESESTANTSAIDALINFETVKYFNNEKLESTRYNRNLRKWQEATYSSEASLAVLNVGQATIIAIGLTLLMVMAGQNVVDGKMTLGDFVLVNAFLLQLYVPLNFLGYVFRTLQNSLVDISRMFSILDVEKDITDRPDARPLKITNSKIDFSNVSFAYHSNRPILRNVSFTVPGGHKIAVVGHSGAGKSTIARLLFRFYETTDGQILIDGQDIRDITLASLRENIGVVPQDTVLFNDTIEYNIRYGKPDASGEEIRNAAKHAYLHEFIESLPEGYQTEVGERGLKLSGGEKQRIAIARTILKNPPILLLDEATSALDSKSEEAIQNALNEIARHRTTLVIAHRLSTIMDADRIIVLDQGRVVETGSHQKLLESKGSYFSLWRLQQNSKAENNSHTN